MVTPNIERGYNKPVGIHTKICKKMAEVLSKEAVARYEKLTLEDVGWVWRKLSATKTTRQRRTNWTTK